MKSSPLLLDLDCRHRWTLHELPGYRFEPIRPKKSSSIVAKGPNSALESYRRWRTLRKSILPLIEIHTRKLHCYQIQGLFFQKFFVVPIQDEYDSQQNRICDDRSHHDIRSL